MAALSSTHLSDEVSAAADGIRGARVEDAFVGVSKRRAAVAEDVLGISVIGVMAEGIVRAASVCLA